MRREFGEVSCHPLVLDKNKKGRGFGASNILAAVFTNTDPLSDMYSRSTDTVKLKKTGNKGVWTCGLNKNGLCNGGAPCTPENLRVELVQSNSEDNVTIEHNKINWD